MLIMSLYPKTNIITVLKMAEEKISEIEEPTSDDVDMLRVVLHTVRGISPVSSGTYPDLTEE